MRKNILTPFFVSLCLVLPGCTWVTNIKARSDLKTLCKIAEKTMTEDKDPAMKAAEFAESVNKEISWGPVHQMMQAIYAADDSQKWQLIKMGAADVGVEDYKCKPLEKMFDSAQPAAN